jgi:hypothetical protein
MTVRKPIAERPLGRDARRFASTTEQMLDCQL